MKRYYFIPTQHEALIAQMIAIWEAQSPTAYVVCTGVFTRTQVSSLGSDVLSMCHDMRGELIPKTTYLQTGAFEWEKYDLLGFCLEGEFPKQYHDLAMSLEGAYSTQSNLEYLQYIDNLRNAS
jgi:hypothetical protein